MLNKEMLLKIFIGFDEVESIAWHTLTHSILKRSSIPISFIPLNLHNLKKEYWRKRDHNQSNDFSYTRFLTPYLSNYQGYALYMDCDMLVTCDIAQILEHILDENKAVYVVKHDYTPKDNKKYLGNIQHAYPKKNWSSFILWNCKHPANKYLDLKHVNTATPQTLHRFEWLKDDEIGELPLCWNWLVGEYEVSSTIPKNIHWTVGGPYFNEYKNVDYSREWNEEFGNMIYCKQIT